MSGKGGSAQGCPPWPVLSTVYPVWPLTPDPSIPLPHQGATDPTMARVSSSQPAPPNAASSLTLWGTPGCSCNAPWLCVLCLVGPQSPQCSPACPLALGGGPQRFHLQDPGGALTHISFWAQIQSLHRRRGVPRTVAAKTQRATPSPPHAERPAPRWPPTGSVPSASGC